MGQVKISDLSVGDWVLNRQGVPTKVQVIVSEGNMRCGEDAKPEHSVHIWVTDVEPIPITPEILEKNGWLPPRKAIELDTWWWTNGVDKAIEAYEYEGEWALTIIEQKEIQYRNRVGIGLKYVHQLQHALRLAGVEKEIEV